MISARASATFDRVHALRRILIVGIAVGAVLAGLVAMHSMIGAPAGSPVAMWSAGQLNATADSAGVDLHPAASSPIERIGLLSWENDESSALGCALIAMICTVLVILVGTRFLARHPAFFRRLKDSGPGTILCVPAARNFAYLPSLTALSISRT